MSQPVVVHVRTLPELRQITHAWRAQGLSIALVPTMGALHPGHLSLARHGKAVCDRLITSIFVNPAQFAPNEDFGSYPRTFDDDLAKLGTTGCDLVWAPTPDVVYPDGFATHVVPQGAATGLETDFRPNFFRGVATVCCKLFTQTQADVAVFGEKDYQQLCVIKQMVRDLDLPLRIDGQPTVREPDGLAMSSRNAYLSADERRTAARLVIALETVAKTIREGGNAVGACEHESARLRANGFRLVDYFTVRDATTLAPAEPDAAPETLRVLVAAWLGKTRLIDNIACA